MYRCHCFVPLPINYITLTLPGSRILRLLTGRPVSCRVIDRPFPGLGEKTDYS